nr:T9SS type A sorting domain-containing protein [Pseudopedobacter sp.]
MNNKLLKISFAVLMFVTSFVTILPAMGSNIISSDTTKKSSVKLTDSRPNRPIFNNVIPNDFESFMFKMASIKSSLPVNKNDILKSVRNNFSNTSAEQLKPIDNVKIYPNPVSDQINLSYTLKKETNVNIKILDVLGNEVLLLLSKKVGAGEQINTFYLDSKLNSGFYFIRLTTDSDSIIKRISVL